MPINFPTSLDSLTNPTTTSTQNSPNHADQHANANDILESLEAKVGIDNSAVPTSLDFIIKDISGGHDHDGVNSKAIDITAYNHNDLGNLAYADAGHTGFEPTIGHTTEDVANKDIDGTLAADSDTKYASQKATKTYADTKLPKATNVTSINDTGIANDEIAIFNLTSKDIRTSNVSITTTLGTDDTTVPTSAAVKAVTDAITVTNYVWQGAWIVSASYSVSDLIESNGSAYICVSAHVSSATDEPGIGANWEDFWNLIAEKGAPPSNTSMVRAYLTAAQDNLVDLTPTKVLLDSETFDVGSNFDTTNHRYVAPQSGYYSITAGVGYKNTITDKRYWCQIYVNGAAVAQNISLIAAAAAIEVACASIEYVVAGQYIELYAQSGAGANTVDLIPGTSATYMSVILLA